MKKGYLSLLLICITFFSFAKKKKKKENIVTYVSEATYVDSSLADARIGAKLIDIYGLTNTDTVFSTKNIPANNNVVLILFNPGCGHCVDATKKIIQDISKFKRTTIFLVTGNVLHDKLNDFIKEVNFVPNEQIIVTSEVGEFTPKIFMKKGIPQVMVYGKDKILRQIFYKEIDIEEVVKYLDK